MKYVRVNKKLTGSLSIEALFLKNVQEEILFETAKNTPAIAAYGIWKRGKSFLTGKKEYNINETVTVDGLITCVALIARHKTGIYVNHLPSGCVDETVINDLSALETTEIVYVIPEEKHLDTYKADLEKLEEVTKRICFITSIQGSIGNVSVDPQGNLAII